MHVPSGILCFDSFPAHPIIELQGPLENPFYYICSPIFNILLYTSSFNRSNVLAVPDALGSLLP